MKNYRLCLVLLILVSFSASAFAQESDDANILAREGQRLNEAKNYTEAIGKFKQALAISDANLSANYQLALALFSIGKGTEGLPYLQKVIDSKGEDKRSKLLIPAAYDLQSLVYFKNKQYAEAEKSAIETIKLSPDNAGAQRTYALVTFHQNKRAAALLGFCSFILMEGNTERSAQAYENIKQIIQGGTLKAEPGQPAPRAPEPNTLALNQAITLAVAKAAKEKHATPADVLTAQLSNIFTATGQLAEKQSGDDFFRKYMAAFFYKMAQSPYMPVFSRMVSGSTEESKRYLKENYPQVEELKKWAKETDRGF